MPSDYPQQPQWPSSGMNSDVTPPSNVGPYQQPTISPLYGQRPTYGVTQPPVYNPSPISPNYGQQYPGGPGVPMNQPQQVGFVNPFDPRSLSEIDTQIIKQCRREAFFYRSLPLSIATCSAVYYYNQKYGKSQSIPKFLLFGTAAYIIGNISYHSHAKERVIKSASMSPFAQYLRQQQQSQSYLNATNPASTSEFVWDDPSTASSVTGQSTMPDQNQGQIYNHDQFDSAPGSTQPFHVTYDQLRARNRGFGGTLPSSSPQPIQPSDFGQSGIDQSRK